MGLTANDVYEIALEAVKKMHEEQGDDLLFPYDRIWLFSSQADRVPSAQRPGPQRRLIKNGFIEPTGEVMRAESAARAGSPTRQYRFGSSLASSRPNPVALKVASTHSHDEAARDVGIEAGLRELHRRIENEGYIFSLAELANFYLALLASPFVILSGISGTGKSLLPRKFAEQTGSGFRSIPVQPQWSDNSDLFGFVPTLSPGTFVEGRLVASLRSAMANPKRLEIVLLDEMNLAPVEHYFSDFLSVMESRRRSGETIITDRLPIELPASDGPWDDLRAAVLPFNLKIIGTANMDETTRGFSPKVLDRAFSIEFDDPELTAFAEAAETPPIPGLLSELIAPLVDGKQPITVNEALQNNQEWFEHIARLLSNVQEILSPAGVKFGFRTRDSILLYLLNWKLLNLKDVISENAALDFCLLQKVLPRVAGAGDLLGTALAKLEDWLMQDRKGTDAESSLGFNGPFVRSAQKARRMRDLLESDGATLYWGV